MNTCFKTSAPGKLFIAGEWSVLEEGNTGIVASVNKRVHAEIKPSSDEFIHVIIRDFNLNLKARIKNNELIFEKKLTSEEKQEVKFIKSAIETIKEYVNECKPFIIKLYGKGVIVKEEGEVLKIGFGSSAASTVAGITALLKFFNKEISKELIYKLSAVSHYSAQNRIGSCFDVAASTYGGVFTYKRFKPLWLVKELSNKTLKQVVNEEWEGFEIKPLKLPERFNLLVGWTKKSASTARRVEKMKKWKKNNKEEYYELINNINSTIIELIKSWNEDDEESIIKLLKQNRKLLKNLGITSGVNIETKKLHTLARIVEEYGGAGKLSGAGGGDCGIGVIFDKNVKSRILETWKKNNIIPINVKISEEGVKF